MTHGTGEPSRRDLIRAAALTGAGLLVASCDVGGGISGGGEGSGSGRINALFMKQAGYSENDIQAMNAAFHATYPGIEVTPTFVAYEALHDKIIAATPAGSFDVVLVDVIWLAEFASRHIITDVTDRFPPLWRTALLPGAMATAGYRGRVWGVPWILDTKYAYYNSDMLARAGVDPATLSTWGGVLAAAQTLKEQKVVEYPLVWSWKQSEALVCDYTQLAGAFGGRILSGDGTAVTVNSGGAVAALRVMKQTLDEKLTNPASLDSLEEDVRRLFSDGQAALALNWTYMFSAATDPRQSRVADQVGVLPTPAGPAGAPGVNGSMALSIAAGSRNQRAAWTYLTYMASPEVQERFARSSLPCWAASYGHASVTAAMPRVVPAAARQLANLVSRAQVPRYDEISQILRVEVQNALLGRKSPQGALDDAARQARTLLP